MYRMDKNKEKGLFKATKRHILYLFVCLVCFACSGQDEKQAAEFFGRGVYHYKKNEFDDALRFFNEALEKNPKLADAHNNIGLIYELRGKYAEAAEEFEKAVRLDPFFSQAKFNQGRILASLGAYDTARQLFADVEATYKDSVNFYIERGQLLVETQRVEDGIVDFERAILLEKQNSQALTNLGYAHILLNDFTNAEAKLKQAIEVNSEEATAYNNLAFLYGILDDNSKALANARTATKLEPNNKIFANNLAYSFLINDNLDDAKSVLDVLSKTLDENSYFLRNMGVLYFKQGNFDKANDFLLEAERKDPGTFMVYYYLGKNSLARKNKSEALKYFTTGSKLNDELSKKELSRLSNG